MSFRRVLASATVALAAISIGGPNLAAQSSRGTSLLVPITGVADLGGMFGGALLVERFAAQGNGIVAVGTVTGALTANGTIRNLVMQVMLPLDIDASRARLNTDPALAQASCDVLHVELGSGSVNVLGSTIGLNPVAFDLASTLQAVSAPPAATTAQSGTVTTPLSGNTTRPGMVAQPAPASTAPQQTATQTPLGSLLCSIDRFRDVSNPAQLVQQLNGVLTALGTTDGK